MLKILIKLHKLLLNMDQESAKSSKASSSSEPANEANLSVNHTNNDITVDSRAPEDMKDIHKWITAAYVVRGQGTAR